MQNWCHSVEWCNFKLCLLKAFKYINTATILLFFHSVIYSAVRNYCRIMTLLVFNYFEFCAAVLFFLTSMCMDPRLMKSNVDASSTGDECQVTPVIHVLQYPGCVPKPIPSFACIGRCASYLQVSGSKIWQMERSCMCCQESGEREASVSLFCPKAKPGERKFRKVSTKAPLECMCRPCTGVEESAVIPQEIAGYGDEMPLSNHFRKSQKD